MDRYFFALPSTYGLAFYMKKLTKNHMIIVNDELHQVGCLK